MGFWRVAGTVVRLLVVLVPVVLQFVLPPLDYPQFHLMSYVLHVGMISSILKSDGITSLALMWAYYNFDYDHFKWKERRKIDLSSRIGRQSVTPRLSSLPHPEGASLASWASLPPPMFTPMDISEFCSHAFDKTCRDTPDFIDIMRLELTPSRPATFCGLLDDSNVGIYMFDQSSDIIVFDTGASVCISNDPKDFVTWDQHVDVPALQGITSRAPVQGSGTISWSLLDDNGVSHDITTKAYFVPDAKVRLFSPQRFLRDRTSGGLVLTPNSTTLYFDKTSPLTFHALNQRTVGMPFASLHRRRESTWFDVAQLGTDVLEPANQNFALAQKELLKWHYRLGHFNVSWVQQFTRPRSGSLIPLRHKSPSVEATKDIKCHACRISKTNRRPDGAHLDRIRPEKDGGLSKEHLRFGSKISTDQFVSSVKGRRFDSKGKEPDGQKYSGGTIYVDVSSGYIEVFPQVSLKASETIQSKRRFERTLSNFGHEVHIYLGDNGVYKADAFQQELKQRG